MEELDIKQIFTYFRRHLWLIICIFLLAASLSATLTYFLITPKYEASATLYVFNDSNKSGTSISTSDITTAQKLIATYSVIMQSDGVIGKVIEKADAPYSISQVRKMFQGKSVDNTEVMKITIINEDPIMAMNLANAFAEVGPSEILRVMKAGAVEILDYATVPPKPSSPSITKNTAIGALLGIMLAFAFVILYEMFNTKVRNDENLLRAVKAPIIGYIPDFRLHQANNGNKEVKYG